MKFKNYVRVARLAAGASLLIGLGDYVLLKIGTPIGPFLFAFGLLGVCVLKLNLFTGKCGFLFEDGIKPSELLAILIANLIFGYLIGAVFGLIDFDVFSAATAKVASWDFSAEFFLRSALCGVIMYLAVAIYRQGSPLGILFGVPLFIFCGFQHSIANVITLGAAFTFDWSLVLCVVGNFAGALAAWGLCGKTIFCRHATECQPAPQAEINHPAVLPGRVYRHFKGDSYVVEGTACHSETKEELVLYRALYGAGELWARPYKMFIQKVDRTKYPNAKQKYRFELQDIDSQATDKPRK